MGPVTLLILDGWGVSPEKQGNAVLATRTPNYAWMLETFPNTLLQASGTAVGLPPGLMGNSEVGHLNIGAGKIVWQIFTLINRDTRSGAFAKNPALEQFLSRAKAEGGAVHFLGLVSDGGVHAHVNHLKALLRATAE